MPKKCIKFVSGFLIPSLDEKKFGDRLKWINKREGKFQIDWRHKGGPGWTKQEAEVFVEWDKHKGHFQPNESGYFTQSKQRFRSLLYKLTQDGQLIKEKSDVKDKKIYCIGKRKQRRTKNSCKLHTEVETSDEGNIVNDDNVHLEEEVFSDNVMNVLEDHTYSSITSNSQNNDTDNRCEEVMDDSDTSFSKPVSEQSDCFEKRVLGERNLLYEEHEYNNVNCSVVMLEDMLPDENAGIENLEIPKVPDDFDFTSVHLSRFVEDKNLMECSELTNHAFEWSNLNNLLHILYQ